MVPQRVGIVLMSALGDVTLGLPVACAIKRARPDAHVTWIAQQGPDALLRDHPAVDEVVLFNRRGGVRSYLDVRTEFATRPFDVILDLQTALKAGLVTWCADAPTKWGIDRGRSKDANWLFTTKRLPPRPRAHMADQFQEFLSPLGIETDVVDFGLSPSAQSRVDVATGLRGIGDRPIAAIIVASSKADKNWSPARLARVCVALVRDYGLCPVLCGGRSAIEESACAEILRYTRGALAVDDQPVMALGSGIPNLLALLERASLVISPDSGPLHMAVAMNRPVIGLYGTTNPRWVGPYKQSLDLLVDRYGEPGEVYESSTRKRPGRMDRITVEDVLERLDVWHSVYAPRLSTFAARSQAYRLRTMREPAITSSIAS